ncbi:MAG: hypothetical protein NTW58_12195 [Actinobacteria bacterium]|nr:hypothetical protein [Actinomycetota bacterium]
MRATGAGNIYVCKPLDPVVFERTWSADEIACAALAQVIVDCLTGPDRMLAEGEALLEWMAANKESGRLDAWLLEWMAANKESGRLDAWTRHAGPALCRRPSRAPRRA